MCLDRFGVLPTLPLRIDYWTPLPESLTFLIFARVDTDNRVGIDTVYGLHWTQLGHWYRDCGTAVLFGTFTVFFDTFWYFNLILKGVKEPLEPERGAEAHEVRRSAEFI